MMKPIFFSFITMLWLSLFAIAVNAYAEDVAIAFEKFVHTSAKATASIDQISLKTEGDLEGKWLKYHQAVTAVKYDVKRSDSLLNPILGLVNFDLIGDARGPFESKREAGGATGLDVKLKWL